MKTVLVTGSAGFIGSALCLKLLDDYQVIGLDNHNDYYDPDLKEARLSRILGEKNYKHWRIDLQDQDALSELFEKENIDAVVNLAAQAGVRYSIENPLAYINTNIVGFANLLEECRKNEIKHLVYASSSSVYGSNTKIPFSVNDNVDHPLSYYAATKKANELMAHSYSNIYELPTTGLRFFTVYGPWGRPDMALFKFTKSILSGEEIDVYNHGNHSRDFTYIDDIVEVISRVIKKPAQPNMQWNGSNPDPGSSNVPWRVYNIGNSKPVQLMDYIKAIENELDKTALINYLPLQLGDVPDTYADVDVLISDFGYRPKTDVNLGVSNFVKWYRGFYKL